MRVLELTRIATTELGIPIPRAAKIAAACATQPEARFTSPAGVEVTFALENIDRRLRNRLMDAIEATPRPRRGRPRKSDRRE